MSCIQTYYNGYTAKLMIFQFSKDPAHWILQIFVLLDSYSHSFELTNIVVSEITGRRNQSTSNVQTIKIIITV